MDERLINASWHRNAAQRNKPGQSIGLSDLFTIQYAEPTLPVFMPRIALKSRTATKAISTTRRPTVLLVAITSLLLNHRSGDLIKTIHIRAHEASRGLCYGAGRETAVVA